VIDFRQDVDADLSPRQRGVASVALGRRLLTCDRRLRSSTPIWGRLTDLGEVYTLAEVSWSSSLPRRGCTDVPPPAVAGGFGVFRNLTLVRLSEGLSALSSRCEVAGAVLPAHTYSNRLTWGGCASAQGGVDLTGQPTSRGAGHHDVDRLRVAHPADEAVPSGDKLDLVDVPRHPTRAARLQVAL
jgi:hypothetical protein